jgi:L-lactate dehydrogenase complex protein LldF
LAAEGYTGASKTVAMKGMAAVLSDPRIYRASGKMARWVLRRFPGIAKSKRFNAWYKQREMPAAPEHSFREWYLKHKK